MIYLKQLLTKTKFCAKKGESVQTFARDLVMINTHIQTIAQAF